VKSKICLVEDELLLREVIQADLEDIGFEVVSIGTCEEAWQVISSGVSFQCLVTDIRTPGAIDGWELARRIRECRPEIAVIYVSGYSGSGGRSVSGAQFLNKPFVFHELLEALARLGVRRSLG
jgi:CheY-like chemotaxis protein